MTKMFLPLLGIALTAISVLAGTTPAPEKVPPVVPDRQAFQVPDRVKLEGWVGSRVMGNEANRLVKIDTARLLEGYRKRPGRQSWDGEHVGKWLHAATLAWVNTGDPALREKLDFTVTELTKCQLEDGYLGTYLDNKRWTEWDVWAHKYNLLGLLTYMQYTGNEAPLPVCRKMADLLCNTFGDEPGKRDIIKAGEHVGMAPTSVLEPMVLLYRKTGEPRYLVFCQYILRAWEQANGPHIISRLTELKRVDKVGNGKAYEMLSCLNGALEYYRTVGGDRRILEACLNGWRDIVAKRLYLTGTASYGEHFHDDFDLPNTGNVGETCVTVTWLQFNAQLLRLTGEARFAEQLERVVLNQLFGAQKPDCSAWGYYVQMEGKKPYSATLDGHCCLSSGPRGVALIPTFAVSTDADGVVVNLYDKLSAKLTLKDQSLVTLEMNTQYPRDGEIRIRVQPSSAQPFSLKLRIPEWCAAPLIRVDGNATQAATGADGYATLHRAWQKGDEVLLTLPLAPRLLVGEHKNQGKVALLYGPLALAADEALLAEAGLALSDVAIGATNIGELAMTPLPAPAKFKTWSGAQVFQVNAVTRRATETLKAGSPVKVSLIPFADAGGTGSSYKVWLSLPKTTGGNLLSDGRESRSRSGNVPGSITDGEPGTFVVTFDGKPAAEDWFAVTLGAPASLNRITFVHGSTFHDGGWFDASAGKPQVQIQTAKGGQWETVGVLKDYPASTATSAAGLHGGERFHCQLPAPVRALAVRVIGKPASGDNPSQAFGSCGELLAE